MAIRHARRAPFTYTQLVYLRDRLDDRNRYELIDGELAVTPAPIPAHQWVVTRLGSTVEIHVYERGLGMVFCAPVDIVFSDLDVVEPDIVYLTAEQVARIGEHAILEPPTLVVEVLSPSTARRDRGHKKDLYERAGVPHYWLVHPTRRTLEAYELQSGRYVLAATAGSDGEFRPALFPELVIPLGTIWPPRRSAR